jgi:hypothetical protein
MHAVRVLADGTGGLILPIPADIIEVMGLVGGETLSMQARADGSVSFSRNGSSTFVGQSDCLIDDESENAISSSSIRTESAPDTKRVPVTLSQLLADYDRERHGSLSEQDREWLNNSMVGRELI